MARQWQPQSPPRGLLLMPEQTQRRRRRQLQPRLHRQGQPRRQPLQTLSLRQRPMLVQMRKLRLKLLQRLWPKQACRRLRLQL